MESSRINFPLLTNYHAAAAVLLPEGISNEAANPMKNSDRPPILRTVDTVKMLHMPVTRNDSPMPPRAGRDPVPDRSRAREEGPNRGPALCASTRKKPVARRPAPGSG